MKQSRTTLNLPRIPSHYKFTITNKIGLNGAKCDDASTLKSNFYHSFVVDCHLGNRVFFYMSEI